MTQRTSQNQKADHHWSLDRDVAMFAISGAELHRQALRQLAEMPVLFLPFALGQERPASPEDTAISNSVLTPCFSIPGRRASPAGIATAVTTALGVLFALGQESPAPPENTAVSNSVVALCFAIRRGRASELDTLRRRDNSPQNSVSSDSVALPWREILGTLMASLLSEMRS